MRLETLLGTGFGGDEADDSSEPGTAAEPGVTAPVAVYTPPAAETTAVVNASTSTGATTPSDPSGPGPTVGDTSPAARGTASGTRVEPALTMPPGCTSDLQAAAVSPPPDLPAGAVVNIRDGTILAPVGLPGPGRRASHVGTHTVTNSQFLHYIESIRQYPWARQLVERMRGLYYADPDRPVTGVSFAEAAAYAAWAGLALPTPEERRHAAAGPDRLRYPWGNGWDARRCRWHRGRNGETTCPVFGYPEGRSPFGLYCCSGNVEEWCTSAEARQPALPTPSQEGMIRPPAAAAMVPRPTCGGSWASFRPIALECASQAHRPACVRADYIGFRLVRPSDDSL